MLDFSRTSSGDTVVNLGMSMVFYDLTITNDGGNLWFAAAFHELTFGVNITTDMSDGYAVKLTGGYQSNKIIAKQDTDRGCNVNIYSGVFGECYLGNFADMSAQGADYTVDKDSVFNLYGGEVKNICGYRGDAEGSHFYITAAWAKLRNKATGMTYVHVNTHLDTDSEELRNANVEVLMPLVQQFIKGGYDVFLTGDFNSKTGTDVYKTVTESLDDARVIADSATTVGTFKKFGYNNNLIDYCFCAVDNTVVNVLKKSKVKTLEETFGKSLRKSLSDLLSQQGGNN